MGIIVTHHQGDFSGGQVDALFEGQSENPLYKKSVKKCFNFVPSIQGGAIRRPGSYHLDDYRGLGRVIAILPYVISPVESYFVIVTNMGLSVANADDLQNPNILTGLPNFPGIFFSNTRGYNLVIGDDVSPKTSLMQ